MAADTMDAKQPREVLDYDFDFSRWLGALDTIDSTLSSSVEVTGGTDDPLNTLTIDSVQTSSTAVKVWLSGGVDKVKYKVTILIETAGGRRKEADMIIPVKNS